MANKEAPTVNKEQEKKTDKAQEEEVSSTLSNKENRPSKDMTRDQLEALRFKLQKKFH